jgi:hypothetical protein
LTTNKNKQTTEIALLRDPKPRPRQADCDRRRASTVCRDCCGRGTTLRRPTTTRSDDRGSRCSSTAKAIRHTFVLEDLQQQQQHCNNIVYLLIFSSGLLGKRKRFSALAGLHVKDLGRLVGAGRQQLGAVFVPRQRVDASRMAAFLFVGQRFHVIAGFAVENVNLSTVGAGECQLVQTTITIQPCLTRLSDPADAN